MHPSTFGDLGKRKLVGVVVVSVLGGSAKRKVRLSKSQRDEKRPVVLLCLLKTLDALARNSAIGVSSVVDVSVFPRGDSRQITGSGVTE